MVKRTGPDVVSSDKQVDPDSPTVDIFHYGTNIMTKDGQLDPNPNGLGDMAGDMWDKIWDNAGAPDGGDVRHSCALALVPLLCSRTPAHGPCPASLHRSRFPPQACAEQVQKAKADALALAQVSMRRCARAASRSC